MQKIKSLQMLEEAYSTPVSERAIWKEIDHIKDLYRQFVEAAPFLERVFYQCQKALARSRLWQPESQAAGHELPSAGQLAQYFSTARGQEPDAEAYDAAYAENLQQNIY